jgi:hypothetical protein
MGEIEMGDRDSLIRLEDSLGKKANAGHCSYRPCLGRDEELEEVVIDAEFIADEENHEPGEGESSAGTCESSARGAGSEDESIRADPVKYVLGEILQSLRDSFVKDPSTPSYVISRRLTQRILAVPRNSTEQMIQEGTVIGAYVFLERYLTGTQKPRIR